MSTSSPGADDGRGTGRGPHVTGPASSALEPARDIGWLITILCAVGALWSSWVMFPNDPVGNTAGTWVSASATLAIIGAMWLRTDAPTVTPVAITATSGGILLLFGAVRAYPTSVTVTMILGGAGIVLGAIMQIRNVPDVS